jgi:H+/Cl- antiporter ClcA
MSLMHLRTVLSHPKTSWQLVCLSVIAAICAASIIVLFRLAFEGLQIYLTGEVGGFANLPWYQRLGLPILGVLGIFLVAYATGFAHFRLGIPYVLHRIKTQYGVIPWRTTVNQFFGGIFALSSGFFVGREGPSVHLGAAGTSFLGEGFRLPYNCIRILAGCGISAGIAASFNTPFAAVIFVMEVILREYRIHIFIPVLLSAAIGSAISRSIFGDGTALLFLNFANIDTWIYVGLVLFGILLGALAAIFNQQLMWVMGLCQRISIGLRLTLAALLTGGIGVLVPEAMGAEFFQVSSVLNDSPTLWLLCAIFVAKFMLACVAIGLGIPGGIIGPVMVIGIYAGAIYALGMSSLVSTDVHDDTFMLLGLAGMLTAVLHAPLAALTAVMELANSPAVILPAIFVIVPAYVVSIQVFNNKSIFIRQLNFQGLEYTQSAISQTLQKTGVLALMLPIEDEHENIEALPTFTYQHTLAEVYDVLKAQRSGQVLIIDPVLETPLGVVSWDDVHLHLFQQQY